MKPSQESLNKGIYSVEEAKRNYRFLESCINIPCLKMLCVSFAQETSQYSWEGEEQRTLPVVVLRPFIFTLDLTQV